MTDFLADKLQEVTERLKELKPSVDEYTRLEAAAAAIADIPGSQASSGHKGLGRPRGSKTPKPLAVNRGRKAAKPTGGKATSIKDPPRPRGRRKGSGARAVEALKHVTDQPGITVPELAAKMGIKQNYLYRVLPALEKEGKLRKDGRGWQPTSTT